LKIWLDGELVDQAEARVSVFDHGLLYGDGCFEGIRVYNGRIFKVVSHVRRLLASANAIRLVSPYSVDEWVDAIRRTVEGNGLKDAYVRVVLTRGVGTLGLNPFLCPKPGVIVIADKIRLYPPELYETGMKVVTAKRPRNLAAALDPAIKSLNYLNNILAKIEAIEADVLEAVMLNPNGFVAECTGDNIFAVKDGVVTTPPVSAGILAGVTRAFVMSLGRELGFTCTESNFTLDELKSADEVFLTGTAAEVIGVNQIDDTTIGNGAVGSVTGQLMDEFRARVALDAPED
jgi:branched-chain amino acid aminotransferase